MLWMRSLRDISAALFQFGSAGHLVDKLQDALAARLRTEVGVHSNPRHFLSSACLDVHN
jgi:hypothetical protein